jgi:F-type H+-transporting ATPase subunit gamma
MSLKSVKNKIRSVKKIRQVTKAMEAVSAVKMRKAQERAIEARPYAISAIRMLSRIIRTVDASEHPLVAQRAKSQKNIIVSVTSDRGLAGGLNSALLRAITRLIRDNNLSQENTEAVAIGKKGRDYFMRRGYRVQNQFERWGEGVEFSGPEQLVAELSNAYALGAFDRVYLVYTNFLSTVRQEPVVRQFLPVDFDALLQVIEGIIPTEGKYSELEETTVSTNAQYIFEPDAESILSVLLPKLLATELYHAVLEANASEHSARMVAMKNASDRARDIVHELTLSYNKARQGAITAEVGEITSALSAQGV